MNSQSLKIYCPADKKNLTKTIFLTIRCKQGDWTTKINGKTLATSLVSSIVQTHTHKNKWDFITNLSNKKKEMQKRRYYNFFM